MTLKLLDCTLRDGGYYNNWKFSSTLANKYLSSLKKTNIKYVEIGFRFSNEISKKLGPFASSKEQFLKKLRLPNNLSLGVMINAADFIENEKELIKIFTKKKNSVIKFVRVAVNFKDLKKITKICSLIKSLGYKVFVNLMQITELTNKELIKSTNFIKNIKEIDVFYIADTFGSLEANQLTKITKIIKKTKKVLGIHLHNNKGLALSNSIEAIKLDYQWIDSTIQGMGRGAGNLKTEELLTYINQNKIPNEEFLGVVLNDFEKLKKKYNWGQSYYYYISATSSIHPTFIQEMLSSNRYSLLETNNAIRYLSNPTIKSKKYNNILLKKAINYRTETQSVNYKGTWNGKKLFSKKNILLIGNSNKVAKNKNKIHRFIKSKKPIIISINFNKYINDFKIDYICACNEKKIIQENYLYNSSDQKIIGPSELLKKLKIKNKIFNYGLKISKKLSIDKFDCSLPRDISLVYAISLCVSSNLKKIYFAGFDGFGGQNFERNEINSFLKNLKNKYKSLKLISLTKTKFKF